MKQSLSQCTHIPDGLEPAVLIWICISAVVVVILAIGADEERALWLGVRVVVPVVVAVDFEVVPNAIIVVVYVPMIVYAIEVVIEIGGVIEHTLRIHIARDGRAAVVIWVDIVIQ